jgi:hypothetical protein
VELLISYTLTELSRNAKLAKQANVEGATATAKKGSDINSLLIAVLFAVIAVLLADKFNLVKL